VLFFNWAPRREGVLGEWNYSSTHSLTSALDGGEWSASRPSRFTSRERTPGTLWIGGWVGPRAVLDVVVKRKIPSPRRESNPRTPIVQPVAQRLYRLSYHGSPRPIYLYFNTLLVSYHHPFVVLFHPFFSVKSHYLRRINAIFFPEWFIAKSILICTGIFFICRCHLGKFYSVDVQMFCDQVFTVV
jgi:hypothetical protein